SGNSPTAPGIHLALIARVKPAAFERFGGLRWAPPISRKDIWPSNHNFAILLNSHLYAWYGFSHIPWLEVIWNIHRANRRSLRKPVDLKHRDAQHHEKELSLDCERSGPAYQRL